MVKNSGNFQRVNSIGATMELESSRILCDESIGGTEGSSLFFDISTVRCVCVRVLFTRTHIVDIESISAKRTLSSVVYKGYWRFCVHMLFTHASLGGVFTPCSHSELEREIGGICGD